MSKLPLLEPSVAVCVDRCGSRCCQVETTVIQLEHDEQARLKRLAAELGIRKLPTYHYSGSGAATRWAYSFRSTGGRCAFLDDHGLCRIYADRPGACRLFPHRPVHGCLVWPADPGDEDADVPAGDVFA